MLTAEQLYVPESLPRTFVRSSFPSEAIDRLICDWLFRLLQLTAGLGLPLTEHWNEANPPSLTVSVLGDTATTGAEIDSPGSPLTPALPGVPNLLFVPLVQHHPSDPQVPWCLAATFSRRSHNALVAFISWLPSVSSSSPGSFVSHSVPVDREGLGDSYRHLNDRVEVLARITVCLFSELFSCQLWF